MSKKSTNPRDYLNQIVKIKIDRPLNYKHEKFDLIYNINYGFVPGTVMPEGEELDAYILGVSKIF